MLILAVRYVIYFGFLFNCNNGDSLLLHQMEPIDRDIYKAAACTARCLRATAERHQLWHQINNQHQQHQQQQQQQQSHQHQKQNQQQHPNAAKDTLLQHCFNFCDGKSNTTTDHTKENVRQIYENLNLKLICRDDRSLTFHIDLERRSRTVLHKRYEAQMNNVNLTDFTTTETKFAIGDDNKVRTTVYFVRMRFSKDAGTTVVYLSDDNFFTINQLAQNTTYFLTVVAVHSTNEYTVIAKEQPYTTLRRGYTPGMVTDIQIKGFAADKVHDKRLMAKISWKPSADMTCHYNIICFSPESEEYDLTPLEIRNPRQLYTYNLENLTFSSSYKVGIRAKNPNNISKESDLFWKTFRAPSCVEWYNYNFNVCAPLEPEGLEVEQKFVSENEFSLNVSWQQPQHFPDYYTLRILDLEQNGNSYAVNVSKQTNTIFIPKVTILGIMYEVHLTAYTPGGHSTAVFTDVIKLHVVVADKNYVVKLISAILAPIFCIAILSLTIFIICHRRAKLKRYQERCKYFEELEKKAPIDPKAAFDFNTKSLPPIATPAELALFQLDLEEKIFFNDEMEITSSDVTLYEILGEGAFGLVRRGIYNDDKMGPREVAVKMLKDHPSADDVRAFRREIEVMKSVERHTNIVGIIGHCTKRYHEMMLLTEYCSLGNLLNFLRDEWNFLHELNKSVEPKLPATSTTQKKLGTSTMTTQKTRQQHAHNKRQQQLQSQNNKQSNNSGNCNNQNTTTNNHNNNNNNSVFNIDATLIEKLKQKYKNLNTIQTQTNSSKDLTHTSVGGAAVQNETTPQTAQTPIKTTHTTMAYVQTLNPNASVTTNENKSCTFSAADNKSYGYNEICTNSCKCRVNVVIRDVNAHDVNDYVEQPEHTLQQQQPQQQQQQQQNLSELAQPQTMAPTVRTTKTIDIKDCECQLLAKNNRKNNGILQKHLKPQVQQQRNISVANQTYFNYVTETVKVRKKQQPLPKNTVTKTTKNGNCDESLTAAIKREPLKSTDLLDIAKQVAIGMEFLSKNKVVHRDLAARNVLVSTDRTIKIADFGLSRDVYQENIYKKTGNGKLPIKWLALESMTHQVYTTQSDVWSYGILLYEIVTLGSSPYPSIPTNRLLHLLKTGYRMEKPKNCGQEFYDLMFSCWKQNPNERPIFTDIIKIIDRLMCDAPQPQIDNAINAVNAQKSINVNEPPLASDESYLKPL